MPLMQAQPPPQQKREPAPAPRPQALGGAFQLTQQAIAFLGIVAVGPVIAAIVWGASGGGKDFYLREP